jgi:hypothetical protein
VSWSGGKTWASTQLPTVNHHESSKRCMQMRVPALLTNSQRRSYSLLSLWSQAHARAPMRCMHPSRTSGHTRSHALPRAVCIPRRTSGRTRSHAFPHKKNRCMSRLTPTARRSFFSWQSRGGVSPSRQPDALNEAYRFKKKPYVKKVFRLYSYLFSSRHEGMHNFLHQI